MDVSETYGISYCFEISTSKYMNEKQKKQVCLDAFRIVSEKINDLIKLTTVNSQKVVVINEKLYSIKNKERRKKNRKKLIVKELEFENHLEYLQMERDHYMKQFSLLQTIQETISSFFESSECYFVNIIENRLNEILNSFPQHFSKAKKNLHARKCLRVLKWATRSIPSLSINEHINNALHYSQLIYDSVRSYFDDNGIAETSFLHSIDLMPEAYFQLHKKNIVLSFESPSETGKLIFLEANYIIENTRVENEFSLEILFLLVSRYFFSEIYTSLFHQSIFEKRRKFYNIISRFKSFSPSVFNVNPIFIPEKLLNISLNRFPQMHEYTLSISFFQELSFHYNPIDFCNTAFYALKSMQEAANKVGSKRNGKPIVFSCDDIIEVGTLIVILSDTIDLFEIIDVFDPYIGGLMLPSELEFAFSTLKGIIYSIKQLDYQSFSKQEKQKIESETDPLGIFEEK